MKLIRPASGGRSEFWEYGHIRPLFWPRVLFWRVFSRLTCWLTTRHAAHKGSFISLPHETDWYRQCHCGYFGTKIPSGSLGREFG